MPHLTDPAEIRAILETDRRWAVYALGDLAPGLFEHCEWLASEDGLALLLVFRAVSPPVLFTLGEPVAVGLLLDEMRGQPELYLMVRPEILPVLRARGEVRHEIPMWRMILDPAVFSPPHGAEAARLRMDDYPALERLYADGIDTGEAPGFFSRSMLEQGVFYGVREGRELIAAADTHLVVPTEGVAAIGSVFTRRDRRGQGLAARVTGAVTRDLLEMNLPTIALNVSPHNEPARRAYDRLGFQRYCHYFEGVASLHA